MLSEERPVEALDVAVRPRPADLRGAVFNLLELQEELVGVLVLRPQYSRPLSLRIVWAFSTVASP